MSPASPVIIKCPQCGNLHTLWGWASGNTFGGYTQWSDGLTTGLMLPPPERPFTHCTCGTGKGECGCLFLHDDAEILAVAPDPNRLESYYRAASTQQVKEYRRKWRQEGAASAQEYLDALRAVPWTKEERTLLERWQKYHDRIKVQYRGVDDCYEALRRRIAGRSRTKERRLRLFTWRETTAPFRSLKHAQLPAGTRLTLSPEHAENLLRLAALCDESDGDDRLLKAECMRQSGRFAEAETLLSVQWPQDYEQTVAALLALVKEKDMVVRMLFSNERGNERGPG